MIMKEITSFEIRIYKASTSRKPFSDWMHSFKDEKSRSVIRSRINRLQSGNFGDCKYLDKGVYELRIHYGKGFRVYFAKIKNVIIVLLCGGDKHTQINDIKKAQEYWELYMEIYL